MAGSTDLVVNIVVKGVEQLEALKADLDDLLARVGALKAAGLDVSVAAPAGEAKAKP